MAGRLMVDMTQACTITVRSHHTLVSYTESCRCNMADLMDSPLPHPPVVWLMKKTVGRETMKGK